MGMPSQVFPRIYPCTHSWHPKSDGPHALKAMSDEIRALAKFCRLSRTYTGYPVRGTFASDLSILPRKTKACPLAEHLSGLSDHIHFVADTTSVRIDDGPMDASSAQRQRTRAERCIHGTQAEIPPDYPCEEQMQESIACQLIISKYMEDTCRKWSHVSRTCPLILPRVCWAGVQNTHKTRSGTCRVQNPRRKIILISLP